MAARADFASDQGAAAGLPLFLQSAGVQTKLVVGAPNDADLRAWRLYGLS